MARRKSNQPSGALTRRSWLRGSAALFGVAPYLWIPKNARAQGSDAAGAIRHLIYIRLAGGFRFPAAFNAAVDGGFNPFGTASSVASGTQWGVSSLLEGGGSWLTEERRAQGLRAVNEFSNEMAVLACVDHAPEAASADGNHQTGLERFLTGYVGGDTGLFTLLNYGIRERLAQAASDGQVLLPAIIMGESGMGRGQGEFAAHRPPLLRGGDLGGFGGDADRVPAWARKYSLARDAMVRDALAPRHAPVVDAFLQARQATRAYQEIFGSEILSVDDELDASANGISNRELRNAFGDSRESRELRLALRLFEFGCPAVYIDQGGYDYHSDEETRLPERLADLNHLLSALRFSLQRMQHSAGGSYWDHTLVVLGSEFSRTTRGRRFNSARGSDHGGDYETRWMSMPMMGGALAVPGQMLGGTRASDLSPMGKVYGYRALMKSLMLGLGADIRDILIDDQVFDDFLVA